VTVAPLWKLLPLMSSVWSLVEAGYELGESPLIDGAAATAFRPTSADHPDLPSFQEMSYQL
jgi:hypothetical protein